MTETPEAELSDDEKAVEEAVKVRLRLESWAAITLGRHADVDPDVGGYPCEDCKPGEPCNTLQHAQDVQYVLLVANEAETAAGNAFEHSEQMRRAIAAVVEAAGGVVTVPNVRLAEFMLKDPEVPELASWNDAGTKSTVFSTEPQPDPYAALAAAQEGQ